MLFRLEISQMGSKNKVKAMLEKFEQRENEETIAKLCPSPTTLSQSTPKTNSELLRVTNSVSERRLLFQAAESCKSPEITNRPTEFTKESAENYRTLSLRDKNGDNKHCKLRRNIPVSVRKSSVPSILQKCSSFPQVRLKHESVASSNSPCGKTFVDFPPRSTFAMETTDILPDGNEEEKLISLPLPAGKPPAKPPRTFEHDTYIALKAKVGNNEPVYATITEKSARQKSGICHENLTRASENEILTNEKTVPTNFEKMKIGKSNRKNNKRLDPYAVTDIYKDGRNSKINFHVAPKRPQSRFFVDDVVIEEPTGNLKRCFSNEHVYDEPYSSRGSLKSFNSDETLVLSNVIYDRIQCENRSNAGGLHYSSTPILKNHGQAKKASFTSWPKKSQRNDAHSDKRSNSNSECDVGAAERDDAQDSAVQELVRSIFSTFSHVKIECSHDLIDVTPVRELVNQSFSRACTVEASGTDDASRPRRDEDSGDSDNELSANEVEKRIIYMRTVSRAASVKYGRPRLSDPTDPRVFDCALVVGLRYSEKNVGYDPYVKLSYPTEFLDADANACPALQFCFPDAEFWKPSQTGDSYTFVLTNAKGERTYGYCRRIKPDESPVALPIVYCVLSSVLSCRFYSQILTELEYRHGSPDAEIVTFLDTLYHCRLPRPGRLLKMPTCRSDSKRDVQRTQDTTVDDLGIECLIKTLDISNLLKTFASLLLERRVVLYSSSLSVVSQCVQALQALLYPFVWQHTFIPILPSAAIDVVGSPTPFLIGVLGHFASQLRDVPMEQSDVLMVDLDRNRIFREIGDELKVLPKKMQKALSVALKMAKSNCDLRLMTVEAFLRMFVETVGHYSTFIVTQQDGHKIFERESFCSATQSTGTATFLQWFTETQMFNAFIDSHIDGTAIPCVPFDRRVDEYRAEVDSTPQSLRDNFKDFGKKVKTLGERLIGLKTPDKN